MTGTKSLSALALSALLLSACSDRPASWVIADSAMGTTFSVTVVDPPSGTDMPALDRAIADRLDAIEQSMSTYISGSELNRFNQYAATDWYDVSADLCFVVQTAIEISAQTKGAFDVTIGPLVDSWGFGAAAEQDSPPSDEHIGELMTSVGTGLLQADCSRPAVRKQQASVRVDLSAIAKGYGVDALAALVESKGIDNYLVEIGGDIRVSGNNPQRAAWSIAIEIPELTPESLARPVYDAIRLSTGAVATSGDYRNFYERDGRRYSHAIDPRSGYPIRHVTASVTVIASDAITADAWATALLVLGSAEGLPLAEREAIAALFIDRDDGAFIDARSSRFGLRSQPGLP